MDESSIDNPLNGKTLFKSPGETVEKLWNLLRRRLSKHKTFVRSFIYVILAVLFNAYFISCIVYFVNHSGFAIDWCDGVGFLVVIATVAYFGLFYFQVVKRFWSQTIYKSVLKPSIHFVNRLWTRWAVRYCLYLLLMVALVTFLIIDMANERERLYSFLGLIVWIVLGFIFSKHPSRVKWNQVVWGIGLQFIFGLIVLRWNFGRMAIQCISDKATIFLSYSYNGSNFVYGYLVSDASSPGIALGSIFAFKVLTVTYWFSFTVNILYYYGTMQWIIKKIGWLLQVSIGTTAAESMNAAANIFLGQTEAPLIIKPFLSKMTKSELHAVMTGGFSTIAGSVLAAYINFGIDAAHLLSASVMSAPAALAFSKLFYPETKKSRTKSTDIQTPKGTEANALDAAARGASNAVFLVANIVANLITFLAFIAFLNSVVSWFAKLLGTSYINFEFIVGKLFWPVAWLMGVPFDECGLVANLVAIKTIVNEFAAYGKLSEYMAKGIISKRSETIATYALCGFSNPGSIGIQIGALSAMEPGIQSELSKVAFRAFVSGSISCFLTACIAGTLISSPPSEPIITHNITLLLP